MVIIIAVTCHRDDFAVVMPLQAGDAVGVDRAILGENTPIRVVVETVDAPVAAPLVEFDAMEGTRHGYKVLITGFC